MGSVGLLSKLDLIGPLSDSSYGSGVYDHVFLPSISLIGLNRDLILQQGIPPLSDTILSITVQSEMLP